MTAPPATISSVATTANAREQANEESRERMRQLRAENARLRRKLQRNIELMKRAAGMSIRPR